MEQFLVSIVPYQSSFFIAVVCACIRYYAKSKEPPTVGRFIFTLGCSILAAYLLHEGLYGSEVVSKSWRVSIIGVVCLISPDIVDFIFRAAEEIKKNPLGFLRELADRFLGPSKGKQDE